MEKKELAWLHGQQRTLAGKTVAITGATGDLGVEICRNVLALGGCLVLVNRSAEKTKALREKLLWEFPGGKIAWISADLTDMASVRRAAARLEQMPLDVLVLNAGAYKIPRETCATGYENVFQINFVSHYYLARRLAPRLRTRGGILTAVGSVAHRYAHTDPADVDFAGRKSCALVYGNSKRYLMYALFGLQRACPDLRLSIVHPGISFTNMTAHYPPWLFALIRYPMQVIFMPPRRAVRSIVLGTMEPQQPLNWIGPRWCGVWGNPAVRRLHSCDAAEQARIYHEAERIYQQLRAEEEPQRSRKL